MTRGDLTHSGLGNILEQEQQRTKVPAMKNIISETFKFADDSTVSSSLKVLANCVTKAPGNPGNCAGRVTIVSHPSHVATRACALLAWGHAGPQWCSASSRQR
eukprot:2933669-Rhodomonas_salina.1